MCSKLTAPKVYLPDLFRVSCCFRLVNTQRTHAIIINSDLNHECKQKLCATRHDHLRRDLCTCKWFMKETRWKLAPIMQSAGGLICGYPSGSDLEGCTTKHFRPLKLQTRSVYKLLKVWLNRGPLNAMKNTWSVKHSCLWGGCVTWWHIKRVKW